MANSKPDYSKLNPKKELNKEEKKIDVDTAINSMYNIAQPQIADGQIHQEKGKEKFDKPGEEVLKNKPEPEMTDKVVRVSVDTPSKIIKLIKRKMLDEDVPTLREYFLNLAKKDLGI